MHSITEQHVLRPAVATMSSMDIRDRQWWSDLLERVLRNEIQALAPLFAAVANTGAPLQWMSALTAAGSVALFTVLKYFFALSVDDTSPLWARLLDRVLPAVAGSLLASIPMDSWTDTRWDVAAWSAAGSAVLALMMFYLTPPSRGVPGDTGFHGFPGAGG